MAVSLKKHMGTEQVAQVWRARNHTLTRSLDVELVESERECYERLNYVKQR